MATRFGIWIDEPNTGTNANMMTYSAFASDTQRENGFVAGQAASSIRVNTALRQATLVTAAFMDLIAGSSEVDMNSSLSDVKTAINAGIVTNANLIQQINNALANANCKINPVGIKSGVGNEGKFLAAVAAVETIEQGAQWSYIDGQQLKSVGASNGQVLTADGSGGASWVTPSGGGGGSGTTYTAGQGIHISASNEISTHEIPASDIDTDGGSEGNVLRISTGQAVWASLSDKQDTLTAGTGISLLGSTISNIGVTSITPYGGSTSTGAITLKTINGTSLVGSGNIVISGGGSVAGVTSLAGMTGDITVDDGLTSVDNQYGKKIVVSDNFPLTKLNYSASTKKMLTTSNTGNVAWTTPGDGLDINNSGVLSNTGVLSIGAVTGTITVDDGLYANTQTNKIGISVGGVALNRLTTPGGSGSFYLMSNGTTNYWDTLSIEGDDLLATGKASGLVLTTDGSGGCDWLSLPTYSGGTGISVSNGTITNIGITSFGGATGAITLSSDFRMTGNQLELVGGGGGGSYTAGTNISISANNEISTTFGRGITGQVLTSNGSSSNPSFQDLYVSPSDIDSSGITNNNYVLCANGSGEGEWRRVDPNIFI